MRRDEPNRHGRAADAFIASYVRELVEDQTDAPRPLPGAPGERPAAALAPTTADAVAPRLEAAL